MDLPTKEQVFGTRETPRSRRGIVSADTDSIYRAQNQAGEMISAAQGRQAQAVLDAGAAISEQGRMYQRMAADIDVLSQKRRDADAKLALEKAKSYVLQSSTELEDSLRMDPDYETALERYGSGFNEIQKRALDMVPQDQRELFSYALQDVRTKGASTMKLHAYNKKGEAQLASVIDNEAPTTDLVNKAFAGGDVQKGLAAIKTQEAMYDAAVASGALSAVQAAQKKASFRDATITNAINSVPSETAYSVISASSGDPMAIISDTITKSEGGFVASDGASGAPAIYGINEKWHPEEYAKAKSATESGGEAAGRAVADSFYKKEYWDKYNLSEFKPDVAKVLFDGVINHHSEFRDKMVRAAKNGASAQELIDMRRTEYERLGAKPEHKDSLSGWNNRLDRLTLDVTNMRGASALADMIPADRKQKILLDVEKNYITAQIAKDPSAAMMALESGALGTLIDDADREQYKSYARSAQDAAIENAERLLIAQEVEKNRIDLRDVATWGVEDVQRYENQHGETPFSRMAKSAVTKKIPQVTSVQKTAKYTQLMDRLADIKVRAGLDPVKSFSQNEEVVLSKDLLSDFKTFQDEVYQAASDGLIEAGTAQSLINDYSDGIYRAIGPKDGPVTEGSGWTFGDWGKIDDPYHFGWTAIRDKLKETGMENNLSARRRLFELYTENFGKFDGKDYVTTGVYESTGSRSKDKAALNAAMNNAIQQYNMEVNPAIAGMKNPPNFVIPKQASATDIPVVNTPAEAEALPSGSRFRTPDGKVRIKP